MPEPAQGPDSRVDEPSAQPALGQGMGALLQENEPGYRSLRRGDVVDGVVVRIDRDGVLVDIGSKAEAIIPSYEIPAHEPESLQVGKEIVAYVLRPEDQDGHAVLSLSRAQAERGWRRLLKHFEHGEVLEGQVLEHNKGGLIVSVLGVRGFVPLSQVADLRRGEVMDEATEAKLRALVGQQLQVKIIEMNQRRNRLILSERAAAREQRAQQKERLLAELQAGEVRHGAVSSVCDFGVFVDLGGADGLVHLSELSWGQVGHPSALVSVGQEVDVYVLAVDQEKKKIALSLKRLQQEPWSQVTQNYEVGQLVAARITKLAAFGAFAEVESGLEGLVHISELSDQRITHPRQVVREGDRVQLRILRIDPAQHRLSLSLRQGGYVDETPAEAEVPEPAGILEVADSVVLALDHEAAARLPVEQALSAKPEDRASEGAGGEVEGEPAPEWEEQGARST